jgi:heterodisulfide reductase subunit B1
MEPYKPDMILTNCPGCPMFLDRWQYAIGELEGKKYSDDGNGIPVLTYEELAGLVLGYNPWDLGLQMHQIDCEPLLDKMGVKYNPEDKHKDINGNVLI